MAAAVEVRARGSITQKAVTPAVMKGRLATSRSIARMSKNWSSQT
jgi:hypothetical protein